LEGYKLILISVIFSTTLFSQNEVVGNFNSCHSGRTLDIVLNHNFKNEFKLGVGVLFNLNNLQFPDNQSNVFKKRLHSQTFFQHIGLHVIYIKPLYKSKRGVEFDLFYNLQIKRASTKSAAFTPLLNPDLNPNFLLIESNLNFGPFLWLQNSIGIALEYNLWKQFYLNQKLGFGLEFIHGKIDNLYLGPNNWTWVFAKQFNLGIVYKFSK